MLDNGKDESGSLQIVTDPTPGDPKTYGSYGSGSTTLAKRGKCTGTVHQVDTSAVLKGNLIILDNGAESKWEYMGFGIWENREGGSPSPPPPGKLLLYFYVPEAQFMVV